MSLKKYVDKECNNILYCDIKNDKNIIVVDDVRPATLKKLKIKNYKVIKFERGTVVNIGYAINNNENNRRKIEEWRVKNEKIKVCQEKRKEKERKEKVKLFKNKILEEFNIDEKTAEDIAEGSMVQGCYGWAWYKDGCSESSYPAVIAYYRHNYTDYDGILHYDGNKDFAREIARESIASEMHDIKEKIIKK